MTSATTIIRITGNKNSAGSPGPGSYNIPSDFGTAPKWSIKNKYKKKEGELLPGYHNLASSIGTGRKSAMSSRPKERDYVETPGPNYVPPKFGSEAPKSAFHNKRTEVEKKPNFPGPADYNVSNDLGGKKYSIKSRKFPPEDGEIPGPGPGGLYPDYTKTMRASTSNSIRPRYPSPKSQEKTPGPSDYVIQRNLSNQTSVFHIKSREIKLETTPGPVHNNPGSIGDGTPKYSMRFRLDTKREILDPAINALPEVFGKARASALSSRHTERDYVAAPGPNYMPPNFGEDATKWTMVSRREKKRDAALESPGPAQYSPMYSNTSRKFTIQSRAVTPTPKAETLGPAEYHPNYNATMRNSQVPAVRERYKEPSNQTLPGYVDLGSTLHGPKFTIGNKEPLDVAQGLK